MAEDRMNHRGGSLPLVDVPEPGDCDVLCGRGGAALRHPGNQTYRRLVNLNKGLYTTCLKTEKLKISRSIVAAIREQNGRFLEKDQFKGTWYDIGDKKAVEKTSQALREGQPKLREKIVELGSNTGTPAYMESQFGHNGAPSLYSPDLVGITSSPGASMDAMVLSAAGSLHHHDQQQHFHQHLPQPLQHLDSVEFHGMQPPPNRDLQVDLLRLSLHDVSSSSDPLEQQTMALLQQRARQLHVGGLGGMMGGSSRASLAQELGITESQLSLMSSNFSAFGGSATSGLGSTGFGHSDSLMSMDASIRRTLQGLAGASSHSQLSVEMPYSNPSIMKSEAKPAPITIDVGSVGQAQRKGKQKANGGVSATATKNSVSEPLDPSGAASSTSATVGAGDLVSTAAATSSAALNDQMSRDKQATLDRRRVFAKMKFNRIPSVRHNGLNSSSTHLGGVSQRSLNDGMPDVYVVGSNLSLYSNLSTMSGVESARGIDNAATAAGAAAAAASGPKVETAKVVDHSSMRGFTDVLNSGSRHSIMSGLSRISDASMDHHSIFSDLSKKIGNVSTRSIAMSDISAIDMQERDSEDDTSQDSVFKAHTLGGSSESRRDPSTEEYGFVDT